MPNVKDYEIRVSWSDEDKLFIARVLEFPSLATHGDKAEEALSEMKELLAFVLDDLAEQGDKIPKPIANINYSGKFNIRIPKSLHRDLTCQASLEGISLNTLVVSKLSR